MDLLLDTHTLAWMSVGHAKLSLKFLALLSEQDTRLYVSAVTAYEFSDLLARKRLPTEVPLDRLEHDLGLTLLDYPAQLWQIAISLPQIHRDPIDRMLIAHAIALDLTLVTADKTIHRYPVKTLW